MKTVIIELPDGRDEALSVTAIGHSCNKQITNIHCTSFDLSKGTRVVWDEDNQVWVQHHHFEMYENMPNILQSQWIPCSIMFPPDSYEGRKVLVTYFRRPFNILDVGETTYRHSCVFDLSDVVAWLPLPEPYTPEGKDGNG